MGKLIFMHIPKTAGSTLASILANQYGPKAVLPLYDSTFGEEIKTIPKRQKDQAAVLIGHFYFGVHHFLQEPYTYVTMLREPVARVVSHYYYVRREPSHYLYNSAKEMSLSEYVVHCNLCEPNNDQTRLLAGGELATSSGICSPEMLSRAKENLREHFAVVGISEEFDCSIMLLRQILHWRMPYYIQKNVTRPRPAIKALTDETIRTIQAYNEMDDDLYRYGKELFQEQIALQGETLEKDVGRFQRINSLFSTYFRLVSIARRT